MSKKCEHWDTWFDRTYCPEPCGGMHTYCADCGENLDYCPHEDPQLPKSIPLPPEPPRDRVIEAVTPHGEVRRSWERYPTGNPWRDQQTGDLVHFEDIVYEVQSLSRFGPVDLSLRHVPAEGGEKT